MALVPIRKRQTDRGALTSLHNQMDDLFRGFFEDWDVPAWRRGAWPALDIAENENEFVVNAEVPGCKAEDIDISVQGSTLTITGEKKHEQEEKQKGYYHIERSYGTFRRDLNLSAEVDVNKIEAACKDGVLTITLPKAATAKPFKVKVKG
jgi:HSP20 family protein